jgi:hypothetical protein
MSTRTPDQSQSLANPDEDQKSKAILLRATRIVADDSHLHAYKNAIRIQLDGDRLVINGRLPTFFLKQTLQEVLRRIDGVHQVVNHVEVRRSEFGNRPK